MIGKVVYNACAINIVRVLYEVAVKPSGTGRHAHFIEYDFFFLGVLGINTFLMEAYIVTP